METFLPTAEKVLRNAYPSGVLDHCGLASIANSRELLVREHVLTILYWYDGEDPLQSDLLHRRDEILPTRKARDAYMAHFRMWGQHHDTGAIGRLGGEKGNAGLYRP
jgi:hypothetical protein